MRNVRGGPVGPNDRTKRRTDWPRRFPGLSADDSRLLRAYLDAGGPPILELHTDIAVAGLSPAILEHCDQSQRDHAEAAWPRRIDAMILYKPGWTLIECKPDTGPMALGQIMLYTHWLDKDCPEINITERIVLTDHADPDIRQAYAAYGVHIHEFPNVFDGHPPRPSREVPEI